MASLILECPHCGAEQIGFAIVYECGARPVRLDYSFMEMMICSGCEQAVVGIFDGSVGSAKNNSPNKCQGDPRTHGWKLYTTYPVPTRRDVPQFIPDPLAAFFRQAAESCRRGHYDASGAMSRKVVDVATKKLLGGDLAKNETVYKRIEYLSEKGRLTSDLKDWAHHVRLEGNDAVHDEAQFTRDEAEELLSFVELFLTYIYSMPGQLAAARAKRDQTTPS
ncbi:DUF4145 domain-containing protein [Phenylobacterium sp.]|uniref:DUF4145 domain-containing protein n=1 Tax=Phenylobacterium sp. TaxID=1871053 RepID=UPI002C8EF2C5|nr:DUF4145 domain-containing protein [Phenylobacterium sp.]HLZ75800.1 DUF4145 domain-containing protein [Phenylobacterium sp.]